MATKRNNGAYVIAIFNTSRDLVDMLRRVFEQAGFVVVSVLTTEIREGEVDLEKFLRQHRPDVVLYDLAPPYQANIRLFEHMCATPAMKGVPVVLTSTNPPRAMEMGGKHERVYEVVDRPFDLDQIINAVREAAHARPTRD